MGCTVYALTVRPGPPMAAMDPQLVHKSNRTVAYSGRLLDLTEAHTRRRRPRLTSVTMESVGRTAWRRRSTEAGVG
jgi:hypothetical protein